MEIKFPTQLQAVATKFCRNPFNGQWNEIFRRTGWENVRDIFQVYVYGSRVLNA